jgi:hypothetical protein
VRDRKQNGEGVSPSAVIVIDVLNRYVHDDAEGLMESMREALPGMQRIIASAR